MIFIKKLCAPIVLAEPAKSLAISRSDLQTGKIFLKGFKQTFLQIVSAIDNRIVHPDPTSAIVHPPRILQIGQMTGNRRLGKLQYLPDITDTEFPIQQKAKNSQAGFICKSFKQSSCSFHLNNISAYPVVIK
jgi:hypothetical protein